MSAMGAAMNRTSDTRPPAERADRAAAVDRWGQPRQASHDRRGHTLLLRLYPPSWRVRYGEEFLALLADMRLSPIDLLDIALGALDARLASRRAAHDVHGVDDADGGYNSDDSVLGGLRMAHTRLRASAITVFCAYIGFVIAGLAFNGTRDDNPLTPLGATHLGLQAAVGVVMGGAVVALLAVLIGGLPIAFVALRQAQRERRLRTLWLFATPPLALLLLILYAGVFVAFSLRQGKPLYGGAPTYLIALYIGGAVLFCIAAIVSAAAVSVAIVRSSVSERWYRFARIPAIVTTLAMVVMLLATVAWGWLANAADAQAFMNAPALFQLSTVVVWAGVVVVMAIATAVAIVGLLRGRAAGTDSRAQGLAATQPA